MAQSEPRKVTILDIETNTDAIRDSLEWLRRKEENRIFWRVFDSMIQVADSQLKAAKPEGMSCKEFCFRKELYAENWRTLHDIENIEKQLTECLKVSH